MIVYPIYRGMAAMFLAVALYSINDALVKWMTSSFHPMQIMFCRSFFTWLPLLGIVLQKESWKSLKTDNKSYHALRAAIMALSLPCYIYAFKTLSLADAYAVAYTAPLFMAIFSIPILGEKIEKHAWIAILIGFSGVLIMMRPGSAVFSLGGLSAFVGGLLWALGLVMGRKISRKESDFSLSLWFLVACFLLSSLFMPFCWQVPSLSDWGLFAVSGLIGGAGLLAITRAFSLAPASIVGPIDYLILVFGVLIGYGVWGDIPDTFVMIGAFVLVLSGLYLIYQETRRKPLVFFPIVE
ncbi:MAG TPA: DMT family transporter [Alphaproteobacteria bacterium]|nr:DMT family transporter [Alphaproteobacteria bacterium]